MLDAVIIAALLEEYNHLPQINQLRYNGFWHFAAEYLCDAFHANDADAFSKWAHSLVDKNARAILTHNPEFWKDDVLLDNYFPDWDLEE